MRATDQPTLTEVAGSKCRCEDFRERWSPGCCKRESPGMTMETRVTDGLSYKPVYPACPTPCVVAWFGWPRTRCGHPVTLVTLSLLLLFHQQYLSHEGALGG